MRDHQSTQFHQHAEVGAMLGGARSPDLTELPGLSDQSARERLAADGPNELPSSESRSLLSIVMEVARQPMFLLWSVPAVFTCSWAKPRMRSCWLFSRKTTALAVLQGLSVLVVCVATVFLALPGHGPDAARALSFATLVVSFLMVILVNRSWTRSLFSMLRVRNPAMWWVIAGATVFLAATLTVPALQRLFSFAPLHADHLWLSLFGGVCSLVWFELLKPHFGRQSAAERLY